MAARFPITPLATPIGHARASGRAYGFSAHSGSPTMTLCQLR